jgi:hypothetical protein
MEGGEACLALASELNGDPANPPARPTKAAGCQSTAADSRITKSSPALAPKDHPARVKGAESPELSPNQWCTTS